MSVYAADLLSQVIVLDFVCLFHFVVRSIHIVHSTVCVGIDGAVPLMVAHSRIFEVD